MSGLSLCDCRIQTSAGVTTPAEERKSQMKDERFKGEIPWENHCMRKFGQGIRKAIESMGKKQNVGVMVHKMLYHIEAEKKVVATKQEAVWISYQPGKV